MNIMKMVQEAKKMQETMQKKMNEINAKEYVESFKNDLVVVKMLGTLEIKEIIINEQLIDKDDTDTLQDVIAEVINNCIKKIVLEKEEATKGMMPSVF